MMSTKMYRLNCDKLMYVAAAFLRFVSVYFLEKLQNFTPVEFLHSYLTLTVSKLAVICFIIQQQVCSF